MRPPARWFPSSARRSCGPRSSSLRKSAAGVLGALLFGTALTLASCDTDPHYPNRMLAAGASNPRPHLANPDDPNDPVILLAFSGGGARATALGLAVLDQLARYSYKR